MKFSLEPHSELQWMAEYCPSLVVRFALWCIRTFSLERVPRIAAFKMVHERWIALAPFCRALRSFLAGSGTFSTRAELEAFLATWPRVAAALGLELENGQDRFEVITPCILLYKAPETRAALMRVVRLPAEYAGENLERAIEDHLKRNRHLAEGFPAPGSQDFKDSVTIFGGSFTPALTLPAVFDFVVASFVLVENQT